jgi:phosphonoacetaldehyde hydrolase
MMEVLVPAARQRGYAPDVTVCASDVPAGRPSPFMCYLNALKLAVYPFEAMIKIGDTIADIQEGLNAGMWTIGLTQSGNELGLTEKDALALPEDDLNRRLVAIEDRYRESGAHYVARGIWEVMPIIEAIQERLARGERP